MPNDKSLISGMLNGIPASEGIAIGQAWILTSQWDEVHEKSLKKQEIEGEVCRFMDAMVQVTYQLEDCRNRVKDEIGAEEAKIFDAHITILNDPFFQEDIPGAIRTRKMNAELVMRTGLEQFREHFEQLDNAYFRQRMDDIQDVANRILRTLLQSDESGLFSAQETIIIAHNLTPSDTARIDPEKVLGFATELGGETSHASILARSKNIPAVVGVEHLMDVAKPGSTVILDGNAGIVYVDPPEKVIKGYRKQKREFAKYREKLTRDVKLDPKTLDGTPFLLLANISMTADVSLAVRFRAEAIGLFRTELPFLIAGSMLSEEEQFRLYKTIVDSMKGKTVTIRTLDLGGDKFLPFEELKKEKNPFMGWRSIRIFLQEQDVFKAQMRAILRASHYGPVRIMYPMISSYEEIAEIETLFKESKQELDQQGIPFDKKIQSGIMIEIPSAAIIADKLIRHCDFMSIGTNDLVQYTLAVDRNNEKVARFYQPTNPAVLQLIQMTIHAAQQANKSVSICGEMGGNLLIAPLLLGMGLREFSMAPTLIPEIKERLRAVTLEDCQDLAERVAGMESAETVDKVLFDFAIQANLRQSVPLIQNDVEKS